MPKITPTPAQQAAISHRGSSLLVSAAAGSGKTRVLTERLMSYITDPVKPVDIDRFLIITFTRAAAAELRSRILDSIAQLETEVPGLAGLRRQSALCYKAQIGTIHSFCTTLLREHCHLLGLRPDFKVLEEDQAESMKSRILNRILDVHYDNIGQDAPFRQLVDTVGAGRDDSRLASLLLDFHKKLMSHPWPEEWAEKQAETFHTGSVTDAAATPWGAYLMERARALTEYWAGAFDALLDELYAEEAENRPILKAYGASLSETRDALRAFFSAPGGWDDAARMLPVPFPKLGALRNSPNPELSEKIKFQRSACKDAMAGLAAQFADTSETLLADLQATAPAMDALVQLTLEFERRYSAEKSRQGVLDFTDLEHHTLALLYDREKSAPSELARSISRRYAEIMIDEYQDVNAVQEMIFTCVSREERNLFMVGDVKQSIYRFRLADPGIFIRKYQAFSPEPNESAPGRRIVLQENFRSRRSILDAANQIFSKIMSPRLGEISYDQDAALKFGAAFYPDIPESPVCLSLIGTGEDADGQLQDKNDREAQLVAQQIHAIINSGMLVSDGPVQRPVRYGDIVILLRSPGGRGEIYSRALTNQGIPVQYQPGANFFTAPEVSTVLSLLAIIDNPHQDVPLIAVLSAPCFHFTPDELAEIRAKKPDSDFYSALTLHADKSEKSAAFLKVLDSFRALAPDLPVGTLLWRIYDRLDLLAVFSAFPDGRRRRENLWSLYEYARSFEQNGHQGLFRFITWLRRSMERGDSARTLPVQSADTVQIMSIHKSKGLEFPIVFLADTGKAFNKMDAAQPVLIHPELGLGPKYVDLEHRIEYPTLARMGISKRIVTDLLSEEMRILYVAMTRAKERLYISAAFRDPEKTIEKLRLSQSAFLAPEILETAACPAVWLLMAAMSCSALTCQVVSDPSKGAQLPVSEKNGEKSDAPAYSSEQEFYERLSQNLSFVYPAGDEVPSKVTATALKRLLEDADREAAALVPEPPGEFRKPRLSTSAAPILSAAERGTATHAALQLIRFDKTGSEAEIQSELQRLMQEGHLSAAQAQAVQIHELRRFFDSPLGLRVRAAGQAVREFRFSLLCDASALLNTTSPDQILLQGMVDLYIQEDDAITIIDYKTDRISPEELPARAAHYSPQIQTYAMALRRITGLPVREGFLYFLYTGDAVPVDLAVSLDSPLADR